MDLQELFRQLMAKLGGQSGIGGGFTDRAPGDPALSGAGGMAQAYTRITHTPVTWGNTASDSYGQYSPRSGNITINPQLLPQINPNPEYMSNVLRHEQVHALLPRQTTDAITQYFNGNPQQAAAGREALSQIDPSAGATNRGLAQEAPAYYAGQNMGLGMDAASEFLKRMPPDVQAKYLQLLRPQGGR